MSTNWLEKGWVVPKIEKLPVSIMVSDGGLIPPPLIYMISDIFTIVFHLFSLQNLIQGVILLLKRGGIRPPSDTMILTGNFSILGTTHPFAYQLVLTY